MTLESVLIDRQRTVELIEQQVGKGVFELANQLYAYPGHPPSILNNW